MKSVREDVEKIHGCPFDTEMIARLVTLVILPLVLAFGAPFLIQYF